MSQFVQFEDTDFQETEESKKKNLKNIDFKQYLNVFEFETTLPGSGKTLKFKPMTTGQLKKLLSYEKTNDINVIENVIDNLINECITSKNFDVNDLYLQDRFFLLVKLREKTKGSDYEITWKCPKCNSQSLNIIDISKLKVTKKDQNIDNKLKINDSLSITLDIIKRGQQKEIIKYVFIKNKKMSEEKRNIEIGILSYASSIQSIITPDGEVKNLELSDKIYLIENLPTSFYDMLKNWHEKYDFGIDFTTKMKCKNEECEYEEKIDIPVDSFFF